PPLPSPTPHRPPLPWSTPSNSQRWRVPAARTRHFWLFGSPARGGNRCVRGNRCVCAVREWARARGPLDGGLVHHAGGVQIHGELSDHVPHCREGLRDRLDLL